MAIQAIYQFGLATSFPAGMEEVTCAELATAMGLPESHIQMFLRCAMIFHVFREFVKKVIAHTPASKLLTDNSLMREWIGMVSLRDMACSFQGEASYLDFLLSRP